MNSNQVKISARIVFLVSAYLLLQNLAAAWSDVKDWHAATTVLDPAFASRAMSSLLQWAAAFFAGLGMDLPQRMTPVYTGPNRRGESPQVAVDAVAVITPDTVDGATTVGTTGPEPEGE